MAQVLKRRSLINSGRRRRRVAVSNRKRRRNGPKRMTAKQIKYFGTARQRAALRASGSRKRRRKNPRNYGTKFGRHWSRYKPRYKPRAGERKASNKRYLKAQSRESNSGRRTRRRRSTRRRKNVGAIYSIGLAGLLGGNPGKRRTHRRKRSTTKNMARRRRRTRRSNAGHRRTRSRRVYVHRRRRRSNPGGYRSRRYSRRRMTNRRHRRRNPGIGGAIGSTTGMLKNALSVIGGAVATRYATQLALGANNSGAIGYLANAIAALALGWAAGKFMKSPQIGGMVTLGGFTGLALRMLSDLTPIGQYVNLSLSGAGKAGDAGIGLITDTTFYVPTVFNSGSMTSAMVPNQITQLIAAGSVGSKAGVGNYRRRRAA